MAKKTIPKKVINSIYSYLDILNEDELPIRKVILFGSYTRGQQRKWSDIDLCIISPKFKNAFEALQYLWSKREISDINYTVEPVGFNPRDFNDPYDSLIHEIKTHGIEIPLKKIRKS